LRAAVKYRLWVHRAGRSYLLRALLLQKGYAAINPLGDTAHIEGIPPSDLTLFGGGKNPNCGGGNCPNNADNSGTLKYVRVEYAGVALSPNNEINGITFGGVGNGTTVDHVQVSYSNDDSYEWFGGDVNAKYIIAFRGIDDDFDTDNGFSGKVQFGVALRDPAVADVSKSHGFESDNDASGSTNLPQTRAVFCNMTIDAGGDVTTNSLYEAGTYIRRNSHLYVYNSIVMGWPIGLYIDGTLSQNNVLADTLVNDNVVGVANSANYVATVSPSGNASVIDLLKNHAGNRFYPGNAQILLFKPYTLGAPDLRPKSASPARTGGNFNHPALQNAFFTKTKYVGALAGSKANDWTKEGWVNWRPDTTDYSNGAFGSVASGCPTFQAAENPVASESVVAADAKVSPNPSNGVFSVALSGFKSSVVDVKISNLNSGKVYYFGKANNNSTTKISLHVPNGNYVIEFTDGKNVITSKVTILN
jgi:Secretion system C-terminal sorting domain